MIRRLLIRPGAIGDFIVSLPAMEALQTDYTEVWCAEQNVPLVRFTKQTRSLGSAGLDRLGFLPAEDVVERLKSFDSIVSWYGTKRTEFRELASSLGLPITFLPALPDGSRHAVEYYNEQAIGLGAARPSRFPAIECPFTKRTYAVIHPFASVSRSGTGFTKRNPMERFEAIASELSKSMPVYWLCGPEEHLPGAKQIEDLYELACWIHGAKIYVGNDSGISHLAAAVGTPTVTLFRSTDPRVWAPRGPCSHFCVMP